MIDINTCTINNNDNVDNNNSNDDNDNVKIVRNVYHFDKSYRLIVEMCALKQNYF